MTFFGAALLTAIATALLAVFAVVTAWYARKAFREQSRGVAAIEQQVKDEQEITRQQAELLKVQAGQLEVLRAQLDDQRKASAAQAEVLKLQAEDLGESLKERERLREAAERQQADEIGFQITSTTFPDIPEEEGGGDFAAGPGESVHMAVVSNESRRPINNVRCRYVSVPLPGDPVPLLGDTFPATRSASPFAVLAARLSAPDSTGSRESDTIIRESDTIIPPILATRFRIRPGEKYRFVFEINSHWGFMPDIAVRFTDDAGLHWQINRDQHLTHLPDRDDW